MNDERFQYSKWIASTFDYEGEAFCVQGIRYQSGVDHVVCNSATRRMLVKASDFEIFLDPNVPSRHTIYVELSGDQKLYPGLLDLEFAVTKAVNADPICQWLYGRPLFHNEDEARLLLLGRVDWIFRQQAVTADMGWLLNCPWSGIEALPTIARQSFTELGT